jgi:hypothetical protein
MIRWTARIWTLACLLFLCAFIFGDAERSGRWPTSTEWIGLAVFPTGIVVGLLIAFRKEFQGGAIAVLSLVGFYIWHFAVSGKLDAGPWFALIAAPGFLFVLANLLSKSRPATTDSHASGRVQDGRLIVD